VATKVAQTFAGATQTASVLKQESGKALGKEISDLGYIWIFTIATIAGLVLVGVAAVLWMK
jgi:hypothetical protein